MACSQRSTTRAQVNVKGFGSVGVSGEISGIAGTEANAPEKWRRPLAALVALACVALVALVALSGCGGSTSLPGGVYTSQQYHFSVTYPKGWQANTSSQPNATAPLIVIITRSGARQQPGSLISSLTINVLNMRDSGVAQTATALRANKALTKVTIGGQPGYRDALVQETSGSVIDTHSDYYVVHSGYLYEISSDALKGDGHTLDTMAQSFTFLG